jgi:hypothetical protein
MPRTILIANQPGGVPREFVAVGLLGAFTGA